MWLGSGVAVAVAVAEARSCSFGWTPSLGISICDSCGPKKQKQTNEQTKKPTLLPFSHYLQSLSLSHGIWSSQATATPGQGLNVHSCHCRGTDDPTEPQWERWKLNFQLSSYFHPIYKKEH